MGEPDEPVLVVEDEAARLRGEFAIEAAGIGTFDWDLVSGELDWDDRLIAMFGYDADSFDRTIAGFNARVHPDDAARVGSALRQAIEDCGEFQALYRVVRPDGELRWISARGRALCDPDGTASRLLGAAYDLTEQRVGEQTAVGVLEAMPAGFLFLDGQWRITYANAEAERLLGRDRGQLLGRMLGQLVAAGAGSHVEQGLRHAVDSGQPVAFDAFFSQPVPGWYEVRAWSSPGGLSMYFLNVTARRRAQEAAVHTAERLALVAQVSRELAGSLSAEAATARLPQLLVPALADGCIVSVLDAHGHSRGVGSWHTDPGGRRLLARYAALRLQALPGIDPIAGALRSGERLILTGAQAIGLAPSGRARQMLAQLAPGAAVLLPLRARGRSLGLLSLLYCDQRRPTEEELAAAQDIADRAGLALDNARLYGEQRQLAEQLQRSLLTAPPEPDHAEIVVRYLPAAEAAAVGGDWYDAFLQRDGATMLVIGDVAGHDTAAAATMGQLRSLLRGIATSSDAGPADVLAALDRSMALLQVNTLATAAVVRLEQTADELERGVRRMRWSNAGHPPPLILTPEGGVTALDQQPQVLLGVQPDTVRSDAVTVLPHGSTVLLYTDGLIERRDADLDTGLHRLQAALGELADRPLPELVDLLLHRLVQGRPDDDVALVAVRLHRQDRPRPAEAGPVQIPLCIPSEPHPSAAPA